jgi:hypothetical protein
VELGLSVFFSARLEGKSNRSLRFSAASKMRPHIAALGSHGGMQK